jgi:hypothetical protein
MLLNLLWTHLDASAVDRQLEYLRLLAPRSRFVVCHGGQRQDFDGITHPDKLFIDDDTLRTRAAWNQSAFKMLDSAREAFVAGTDIEAVFLFEYDHLVLRRDFERALKQLLDLSGADFLAKTCVPKDTNNWVHAIRARHDAEFMAFLRQISTRDDPARLYGCLGTGFVIRRTALEALLAVTPPALDYHELYLPTVLHHLGFRLADVDALSDIYDEVSYLPAKTLTQVLDAKRRGHFFVHPFKQLRHLDRIREAPGPPARLHARDYQRPPGEEITRARATPV